MLPNATSENASSVFHFWAMICFLSIVISVIVNKLIHYQVIQELVIENLRN